MKKKTYGVNVGEELTEKIEALLEYGDYRSERIRHLLRMGLAAEEELQRKHMIDNTSIEEKCDIIAQAVASELDGSNSESKTAH
jgi:metal-responsive CopG/Arc/MetJ family transcriptional regulator